jgi:NADPH:quinone reductase-like Zn-dependent oxidoreductase
MKAIVYHRYGPPSVLRLGDVPKPTTSDDEVLVEVHAASVNAADVDLLHGKFMVRPGGLFRPKYKILGSDIAGRVEAVGKNVTQFRPGDEIFGDLTECGFGAFAEYAIAREDALSLKPAGLTFEQAAAVPSAAILALQGLHDIKQARAGIRPGQKVLINGAGGSVGPFAVQIAKVFGAEVTAVDSAEKLDMLRSIGADHVIDYRQEDFAQSGQQYDLILDNVATRSVFECLRALNPNGAYVVVGGSTLRILQTALLSSWIAEKRKKTVGLLMWKPNRKEDVAFVKELLEAGRVRPIIDRTYPLHETPEALRYLEEGLARGKVVITVHPNGSGLPDPPTDWEGDP